MTSPTVQQDAGGFTSREAAALVGIGANQIRRFVKAGFLDPERTPENHYLFSFQDLRFLKNTTSLLASDVPRQRVHRALRELRRQHPDNRPLSELRLTIETGEILADDGHTVWQADSGQLLMDWDSPYGHTGLGTETNDEVSDIADARAIKEAEWWYDQALDLEDESPAKARLSYRQAITLDPYHINARINLGRLLHIAGHIFDAVDQYREALRLDPERATAAYNLGVALEDAGQHNEAFTAYAQAIAADPELPEAHGAIAHLYERSGDQLAAARHLKRFNQLMPEQ